MKLERRQFVDGAHAEVAADGSWDLTLPDGAHVRGKAPAVEAWAAITAARSEWIFSKWDQGVPAPRDRFLVPLR